MLVCSAFTRIFLLYGPLHHCNLKYSTYMYIRKWWFKFIYYDCTMTYGLSSSNHLCSVLSIHRWWEVGRFCIPSTTSRPALWRWLAWAPLGRGTWNADGRRLVVQQFWWWKWWKAMGSRTEIKKLLTIHWFQNQKWTCWIPSTWTGMDRLDLWILHDFTVEDGDVPRD